MWKTQLITHKIPSDKNDKGISTRLFMCFYEDFHSFLPKKNINLLYLHQNWKLWINYLNNSLSERKNP
jgi:hypothetical protein